ncbi:3',5'-cyclic-AMP phosphodiesterase [Gynuella sunshinyii]|uniref:Putative phosphohydrolase n=1 Tax=Gynuella sunshinyii YC6258 TaxID=1445510 RepID=A0A0C5VKI7_9GAMM|nr:3',5'-cyclic-AMP phosphodiesterase [Gynuella sunshinyii]AJQ93923.1 putative phosphohydrolase [Gynuella sunshinyii YC6258]
MSQKTPFQLIQITDPHLHAGEEGTLLGLQTQKSLDLVLDKIREEQPVIDALIATGDIAQDSSLQAYQRFKTILEGFGVTIRWCPGNHDNKNTMNRAAEKSELIEKFIVTDFWVILLLDSSVPHKVYGRFGHDQFELVNQVAGKYPDKHILIAFHHHPLPMGSHWIDQQQIKNGSELLTTVRKYPNIKALLWGHVHQERDEVIDGLRFISTPSTCVQFEPHSEDFSIDKTGPGYRWLKLYDDGSIETAVSRVQNVEFEIDYSVKGY